MKRSFIAFSNSDSVRGLDSLSRNQERLAMEPFKGEKVVVTIENYKRTRSLGQNNLFHLICGVLAKELGETMLDMKIQLKAWYGVWEPRVDKSGNEIVDAETGEIMMRLKSTSDYSTEEKTALIDGTYDFAKKAKVKLPDPEDLRNNNIKW